MRKILLRWLFISGTALGLIAVLVCLGFVSIHTEAIIPARTPRQKAQSLTKAFLAGMTHRDLDPINIKRIRQLGGSGEIWTVKVGKGGKTLNLLSLNGGKIIAAGLIGKLQNNTYVPMEGEKPPKTKNARFHIQALNLKAVKTYETPAIKGSRDVVVVEYYSPRCPACLRLTPVLKKFVKETGATLYSKLLASPLDKAAVLMSAALDPTQNMDTNKWWIVRQALHSLMVEGAGEQEVKDFLPAVNIHIEDVDPDKLTAVAREADEVGIRFTPTFIVNGRVVSASSPEKLSAAFKKAALKPISPNTHKKPAGVSIPN